MLFRSFSASTSEQAFCFSLANRSRSTFIRVLDRARLSRCSDTSWDRRLLKPPGCLAGIGVIVTEEVVEVGGWRLVGSLFWDIVMRLVAAVMTGLGWIAIGV
uniref:(northern house mosquito) hypothetical protein n=1 Tax=Culex pipiens TaxID=7175 RepID=A0A8D8DUW8_CULPI